MIQTVAPAERRILARMVESCPDLIPEEAESGPLPTMGFRGMRDLQTALACVEKGFLVHLGNARFRMTDAGISASINDSPARFLGRG
jgi:hypothetical protein